MTLPESNVLWTLAVMAAALLTGSIIRLSLLLRSAAPQREQRLASLRTWWTLALVLALAVLAGPIGIGFLLAVLSLSGLREYTTLIARRRGDRWSIALLYGLTIAHYLWIVIARPDGVSGLAMVAAALLICSLQLWQGETKNYVRSTAGLLWGGLLLVIAPAHAVLLSVLPADTNPVAGGVGWFVYLILLTESNDIAQALIGRRFRGSHRHQISPTVSPNKSWEGFLGGLATTMVLAVVLAPVLTPLNRLPVSGNGLAGLPFNPLWSALAGMVISISGFLGDVNLSAVKRDVGVKDSSDALPGMGGVLDRIDSLTFSAPAFYYLIRWLEP